ncbi:hypothetical protein NHH03_04775 [Stieleria sp. TO1_6]|uniref:hypothetical protein n=1 Tax=Stieleria tagensis TaxID=2956795 RepID=UPI00209B3B9C|nr:hypothetical protein [Stieleria tagensis]MCO8121042.1 hypothetical protein [Stieleria tagensis]
MHIDTLDPAPTAESTQRTSQIPVARVAWSAVLVLVVVFIALLTPIPFMGRVTTAIGDLVHAPLFGSLALASLWAWSALVDKRHGSGSVQSVRTIFGRGIVVWSTLSVFGLFMEWLQSGMGRSASWHDALANALGIAAAVCAYSAVAIATTARPLAARCLGLLAVTLFSIAWYPPVELLADVVQMHRRFPLLGSFESEIELTRWYSRRATGRISSLNATEGDHSYEIQFQPNGYPAVSLVDLVQNWTGYTALEVDASLAADSSAETVTLLIQVIDKAHRQDYSGTLKKRVRLSRGQSRRIRISLTAAADQTTAPNLDLTQITFVDFTLEKPAAPTTLRLDRLILCR